MKDNRTIEEQISELTEEQRKLIPKIYKNHLIVSLSVTVPGLLLMLINIAGIAGMIENRNPLKLSQIIVT